MEKMIKAFSLSLRMYERASINLICQSRRVSAWINSNTDKRQQLLPSTSNSIEIEEIFVKREVQNILKRVMGVDIEKVYSRRLKNKGNREQRLHYTLMTDEKLAQTKEKYEKMAKYFLQLVPIKEPRPEDYTVISHDKEIDGHDESSYVFYDIRDATDDDRLVVYREPNGVLRTAKNSELRRWNRAFYPKPDRSVYIPAVFYDPALNYALNLNKHELILDYACWYFEPDELQFVRLVQEIVDRTVRAKKLENIYGTRHFATAVFYLTLNNDIEELFKFFALKKNIGSMGNIVRLYKIMYENVESTAKMDDFKLVYDFAVTHEFRDPDLRKFLNLDILDTRPVYRA